MAYTQIPSRTTADTNSPDDVNQIQDNFDAILGGAAPFDEVAAPGTPAVGKWFLYFKDDGLLYRKNSDDEETEVGTIAAILNGEAEFNEVAAPGTPSAGKWLLYFKSDGKLYKKDSDGVETEIGGGGGGGGTGIVFDGKPGDFYFPSSNPAVLDTDIGTSQVIKRYLFDDTTMERLNFIFRLPSDISSYTNISIELTGYASTAAADDVEFVMFHTRVADGAVWDNAFGTIVSGAQTLTNTQDAIDILTFPSVTIASQSWADGDLILGSIVRFAGEVGDTLTGDFGMVQLRVRLT
jgi:hypothetical protein